MLENNRDYKLTEIDELDIHHYLHLHSPEIQNRSKKKQDRIDPDDMFNMF